MVTKLKKVSAAAKSSIKSEGKATRKKSAKSTATKSSVLSDSVRDSAQQIWQAGLGAFNKAQAGGTKAFEALVKEGVSLQRKTQSAAEEKISEATQRMTSMATDISSKASGQWDKLESIFEDRVAKALNKLGVPSAKDVDALIARIDALNASVQKLTPKKAAAKPATETVAKPVAKVAAKQFAAKTPAKAAAKVPAKAAKPAAKVAAKAAAKPIAKAAPRKPATRKSPAGVEAAVEAAIATKASAEDQANPV
ncbi:MAG: phasin family protein [Rhodoferax sp.]|uniref:phasin family protein n=1 Tax=Rhodoferax sp. TaxID=50421 RepID=UPI002602CA42|nr:phasin family protein [Rhodoferax sp.]MDD2881599.1 phasin family protein [Rhodoferax sp.]